MYGIIKRLFVSYGLNFAPKLYEVIRSKGYNTQYFRRDAVAGLTLAIISIPLGMAFAIASGVSPAQGLYTAVVAGFFIALLGGCRYQIGGPNVHGASIRDSSSTWAHFLLQRHLRKTLALHVEDGG